MAELFPARQTISDAATEWAFAAGWRLVKLLPEGAAYRAFNLAADALWRMRGGGVVQWERNQQRIHPHLTESELAELSRAGLRSYLRYWCDAFRLPTWSHEKVNTFTLDGRDQLDAAMASGSGAIMVLGHSGNWDHAGAWACQRYGSLATVAERLKPEGLYSRFLDYRRSLGMEILPLGDPDVLRTLARRLEQGGLVCLVGDRDITRHGIEVDFFGEPAAMPAGAAVLAMLTGAPLHPVSLWYEPIASTGTIHERIPVPATGTRDEKVQRITQQIADAFANGLREHSVDWHMMQAVWLADLDPMRRR